MFLGTKKTLRSILFITYKESARPSAPSRVSLQAPVGHSPPHLKRLRIFILSIEVWWCLPCLQAACWDLPWCRTASHGGRAARGFSEPFGVLKNCFCVTKMCRNAVSSSVQTFAQCAITKAFKFDGAVGCVFLQPLILEVCKTILHSAAWEGIGDVQLRGIHPSKKLTHLPKTGIYFKCTFFLCIYLWIPQQNLGMRCIQKTFFPFCRLFVQFDRGKYC